MSEIIETVFQGLAFLLPICTVCGIAVWIEIDTNRRRKEKSRKS